MGFEVSMGFFNCGEFQSAKVDGASRADWRGLQKRPAVRIWNAMEESITPRSTGLDARFDQELAAEIPGWQSEFGMTGKPDAAAAEKAQNPPAGATGKAPALSPRAAGLEARFEAELAAEIPDWRRVDDPPSA
jgi:hypothetical protein